MTSPLFVHAVDPPPPFVVLPTVAASCGRGERKKQKERM